MISAPKSITSIIRVRSSPLIDSTDLPDSSAGATSCCVITPSIRTVIDPSRVTAITTRVGGSKYPDGSSWVVIWETLLVANVSSKPLGVGPPAPIWTLTSVSASITARGAGSRPIPVIRLRVSWLATCRSWYARGQRDHQHVPRLGQPGRAHGQVGVSQQPVQRRVAQCRVGDQVDPIALARLDLVQAGRGQRARRRQEPPQQVRHLAAVGCRPDGLTDVRVTADAHGRCSSPSGRTSELVTIAASCSTACR